MSLNRYEQVLFDYLQSHPDERQYWEHKVQTTVRIAPDDLAAGSELAHALWAYFEERASVTSPFKEIAKREGLQRTSMRNLAEYLVRLWTVPRRNTSGGAEKFSNNF